MSAPNDYITKAYFDQKFDLIMEKINWLTEKFDWMIGEYKNMMKS